MVEPFVVEIKCVDAEGKEFVLFRNSLLGYEALVAVQAAIAKAFVGLGEAAVELRKQKPAK